MQPFSFTSYRDFLRVALRKENTNASRRVSHQAIAKRLGYRSPQSIAMIFNGTRRPSYRMIDKIAHYLELDSNAKRYLKLLVELERCQASEADSDHLLREINKLRRQKGAPTDRVQISADQYELVADWYHLVIKQLIASKGFKENVDWVFKILRRKVTRSQIRGSFELLARLAITTRTSDGKLTAINKNYTTAPDVAIAAGRKHLKAMLQRAIEALDEQDVTIREFDAKTFRMKPDRIKEAKQWLRQSRDDFLKEFSDENASDVYQFNVQLFQHTNY